MTNKSMVVQLSGKDGIFSTNKEITLFHDHETTVSLKEKLQAVKKEVVKMAKNGEVSIDLLSLDSDSTWKREDKVRMFVNVRGWSDSYSLDFRKFNGYDFSTSEVFNFASTTDLFKYVYKMLVKYADSIIGSLPEDKCTFAQSLDSKYEYGEIMVEK